MASLLIKRFNKSFLRSAYGLANYNFNSSFKPDTLNLTNCFSSVNENVMPAHQEIVDNITESEKLFTKETINLVNSQIQKNEEGRLFAVVHVAGKQFKITAEDIIIVHAHWPPKPGDEIVFEKVLLVGGKDFTLIGRPVLPSSLVSVKGTVIEKDLSHTKTHFVKVKRKQYQRINFIRNEHTMVRINEIKVTGKVGDSTDSEPLSRIKPES